MALRSPQEFTIDLLANGERQISINGQAVTILAATGTFALSMGDGAFTNARAGITYPLPADETFGSISIRDTSAAPNTIVLIVSFAEIKDARLTLATAIQVGGNPVFDSLADDSVALGATEVIFAADADRREAIITNLATNTATFRIGDAGTGAANGIPLPPGATLVLNTTAEIRAHNPAGVAESLALSQTKGA